MLTPPRLEPPEGTPPKISEIMRRCLLKDEYKRPDFEEISAKLDLMGDLQFEIHMQGQKRSRKDTTDLNTVFPNHIAEALVQVYFMLLLFHRHTHARLNAQAWTRTRTRTRTHTHMRMHTYMLLFEETN